MNAARSMAELLGFISGPQMLDLEQEEMLLQIAGDEAVIAKRPNYLTDPAFAGMFDENPLFDKKCDPLPEPQSASTYAQKKGWLRPILNGGRDISGQPRSIRSTNCCLKR